MKRWEVYWFKGPYAVKLTYYSQVTGEIEQEKKGGVIKVWDA